jgi:putative aldouronate transport system permease protein
LFFLALPAVVFLIIFRYFPMYGILLPVKDYIGVLGFFNSTWVGFENFRYLFSSDAFAMILCPPVLPWETPLDMPIN